MKVGLRGGCDLNCGSFYQHYGMVLILTIITITKITNTIIIIIILYIRMPTIKVLSLALI